MQIPLSWIKQYVEFQETPENIAHLMTMGGVEIGNIETIGETWEDDLVVCGKIISIDPHPNADRLQLPTVDVGDAVPIQVVCGAPNIEVGQLIAFAKAGSTIINPKTGSPETLKPATIRGVESQGMICSALELGLDGGHEGILVLTEVNKPGIPLKQILGDSILEIELTPNRPDCLSIMGNSYEIGALTSNVVKAPEINYPANGEHIDQMFSAHIDDPFLCPRYTGLCISGIVVEPSPKWMQNVLLKSGQRPINNIVDITNYVMLEMGQPLHAFDLSQITGNNISVRQAHEGEKITTLDGQTHSLRPPMLVIANDDKPIGLAGIMGGVNSEVDEQTTEIFLESANFNSTNIRSTRTTLGLNTEASYRFERNLRPELAPIALSRAAFLINRLTGGEVSKGKLDHYPGKHKPKPILLSEDRIERVLGTKFALKSVWQILQSLGFEESKLQGKEVVTDKNCMWVIPPYWRSDIEIEDDLVEEFARIYGYNNLPSKTLDADVTQSEYYPELRIRESLRDNLVAANMIECINYSVSELAGLRVTGSLEGVGKPLVIANPMDSTKKYLRTSLRTNLLYTLSTNRPQTFESGIRIFEIGHVFSENFKDAEGGLPNESENLCGLISGPRETESLWAQHKDWMDFYDLKGILEYCFNDISGQLNFEPTKKEGFEPGHTAVINFNGAQIGWIGLTSDEVNRYFELGEQQIFLFELNLDTVYQRSGLKPKKFIRGSRFPSSFRDLSVIGKDTVTAKEITQIILSEKIVTAAYILDTYKDEAIGEGNTSLTIRIVYQSMERTLRAVEIDKAQENVLSRLAKQLGVKQRFTG